MVYPEDKYRAKVRSKVAAKSHEPPNMGLYTSHVLRWRGAEGSTNSGLNSGHLSEQIFLNSVYIRGPCFFWETPNSNWLKTAWAGRPRSLFFGVSNASVRSLFRVNRYTDRAPRKIDGHTW